MKLVKPRYEILTKIKRVDILKKIEMAGRTCYKSDSEYTEKTGASFLSKIIKRGHLSVIEHVSFTVKFICDRGVTHELVRHRLCAFSQESTRYCNYSGGLTFIIPLWLQNGLKEGEYKEQETAPIDVWTWCNSMLKAEKDYKHLLQIGWTPQQARSVLPNSLKTEIVTTANLREWKHIFNMRTSNAAHPQIREIMIPLQTEIGNILPELF